jgi:hypothetical protein
MFPSFWDIFIELYVVWKQARSLNEQHKISCWDGSSVCLPVVSSGQRVWMLHFDNFAVRLLDTAKFSTLTSLLQFSCTLSTQILSWTKISILTHWMLPRILYC